MNRRRSTWNTSRIAVLVVMSEIKLSLLQKNIYRATTIHKLSGTIVLNSIEYGHARHATGNLVVVVLTTVYLHSYVE